jgi:hypothetical protein
METQSTKGIVKVLSIYADKDTIFNQELEKHLSALKIADKIVYEKYVVQATSYNIQVPQVPTADIFLLLLSADLLSIGQNFGIVTRHVLEKYQQKTIQVILIMVRSVFILDTPFSKLPILPTNGEPIANFANQDIAWHEVVQNIHDIIKSFK